MTFDEATVDHKIAISQGGYDRKANTVLACKDCNKNKGVLTHAEFLAKVRIPT